MNSEEVPDKIELIEHFRPANSPDDLSGITDGERQYTQEQIAELLNYLESVCIMGRSVLNCWSDFGPEHLKAELRFLRLAIASYDQLQKEIYGFAEVPDLPKIE